MKKTILFLVTLGVLGGAAGSLLRAKPETDAFKVAVVDFQRAINETADGKKAESQLNAALEEKKKKFEILKNELEGMRTDFEKQRLVLSGKPLEDKRQALQQKLIEIEKTGAGYEQELARKKGESLQKIINGLQTVVREIGQKESYDFIFEKSQGGVLFSSGAEDITDRVIKAYDKLQ
ncbi:MAG: OmpH family outer membrane protein [Deltaproteobacteria bacterium]|nr:OmpH family outer membrane protein [Deltaproteobacteria bacterium]